MKIYDYAIVGGGVAGLATAEIFARSGFSVCLIEKNEKLCMETSGMHHEWFHFGSLYSIFPSNQFLRTMVGGIDDLLLYYRDFDGMNLRVNGKGELQTIANENAWIRQDNLKYIITTPENKDFKIQKTDSIRDLPYKVFMKYAWKKAIKQFVSRHNRFYQYDWRKGNAAHYIPRAGWMDYSRDHISELNNPDVNLDSTSHYTMKSYDSPMTAKHILRDLVRSYLSYGGEILTESPVEGYEKINNSIKVTIGHNKASIFSNKIIFSSGKGISKFLKSDYIVKTVLSPLLVAYPKVCSENIVRLTPFIEKTINHLKHSISGQEYSLIGGGYFAAEDDELRIQQVGEELKNRAKNVFPKIKDAQLLEVYFGKKTEVISKKSKRNYLYHIMELEKDVFSIVPGKFSLAFSLAVNTYFQIMGHYPNTYVTYDKSLDVSKYLGSMKHKSMIESLVDGKH
ncbi:MAG: FAD-dependent oxidoreductase [Candidatus Scalindua sp.]|jgi:hypothetical protein|nr:FAD-dependent oxidoreductase [Candidatus Scalindua sp.]